MSGPSFFDGLRKTSFAGNEFPAERIVLFATGRQHVHEFPHQASGAPEKLGRGIWHLQVRGNFSSQKFASYGNGLYPERLNLLRGLYETQTTATFVHPTVGEFQAFIIGWRQEYEPGKIRSGEKVDIEFLEDQRSDFLAQNVPAGDVVTAQANFDAITAKVKGQVLPPFSAPTLSLFDSLRAAVNAVSALGNTVTLYSQLYLAKIQETVSLCQQIDDAFMSRGPEVCEIIDALHDLQYQAQQLSSQAFQLRVSQKTLPSTMSITDVAQWLYKDTSRASDLLSLNVILDPTAIPAATVIKYFP